MRSQLIDDMAGLEASQLKGDNVSLLQDRPGVYEIFLDGDLAYVGKASRSLRDRLLVHLRKLSGREQGLLERCTFKVLYIDEDLSAFGPEYLLIKGMKEAGNAPWNFNGFGNKDPGRQRDTTVVKAEHFDAQFPIDLGVEVLADVPDSWTASAEQCLTDLKKALPFNLRFDKQIPKAVVSAPTMDRTAAHWFRSVIQALPEGWMITALPGYVILYRESDPSKYESRTRTWRKVDGSVEDAPTTPELEAGEVEEDPEPEDAKSE